MIKKENNKIDKYKEIWANKRYRALIKLGLYFLFIILVCIYITIMNKDNTGYNYISNKTNSNIVDNNTNNTNNNNISNYNMDIFITKDNEEINYLYKNNNYYILENDNYILTTEDKLNNIISNTYLDINNIYNYINIGILIKEEDDTKYYKVNLQDIVLDCKKDEYIYIDITDYNIKVDYSNLINYLDNNISSCKLDINIIKE